jgi:hypothetical protein
MSYIPGDIRADIYQNYDRHDYALITIFVRRPDRTLPQPVTAPK